MTQSEIQVKSLHGLSAGWHFWSKNRSFLAIPWFVLLTIATFAFFAEISILLYQYYDYPTTVVTTFNADAKFPYPAVTICNENPVKKSDLGSFPELAALQEAYSTAIDDLSEQKKVKIEKKKRKRSIGTFQQDEEAVLVRRRRAEPNIVYCQHLATSSLTNLTYCYVTNANGWSVDDVMGLCTTYNMRTVSVNPLSEDNQYEELQFIGSEFETYKQVAPTCANTDCYDVFTLENRANPSGSLNKLEYVDNDGFYLYDSIWRKGEPDNLYGPDNPQDCVAMSNYVNTDWEAVDISCSIKKFHAVCQFGAMDNAVVVAQTTPATPPEYCVLVETSPVTNLTYCFLQRLTGVSSNDASAHCANHNMKVAQFNPLSVGDQLDELQFVGQKFEQFLDLEATSPFMCDNCRLRFVLENKATTPGSVDTSEYVDSDNYYIHSENWADNEPNHEDNDCIAIQKDTSLWQAGDALCSRQEYYIVCQSGTMDPAVMDVTTTTPQPTPTPPPITPPSTLAVPTTTPPTTIPPTTTGSVGTTALYTDDCITIAESPLTNVSYCFMHKVWRRNYDDMSDFCTTRGMRMITVNPLSQANQYEEMQFIGEILIFHLNGAAVQYGIPLENRGIKPTSANFDYVDKDGFIIHALNWISGEPNAASSECSQIIPDDSNLASSIIPDWKAADYSCTQADYYVICQFGAISLVTETTTPLTTTTTATTTTAITPHTTDATGCTHRTTSSLTGLEYCFDLLHRLTYQYVDEWCVARGMRMVTVNPMTAENQLAELTFLGNYLASIAYIGPSTYEDGIFLENVANQAGTLNRYEYVDNDGYFIDDSNWATGEPDMVSQGCVVSHSSKDWRVLDLSCDLSYYVICQSGAIDPSVTVATMYPPTTSTASTASTSTSTTPATTASTSTATTPATTPSSATTIPQTSTNTTTAASASSVTTTTQVYAEIPLNPIDDWSYVGCFTDKPGSRSLVDKVNFPKSYEVVSVKTSYSFTFNKNIVSVQHCLSFCSGFRYAGILAEIQCFCGNELSQNTSNPSSGCNMTCPDTTATAADCASVNCPTTCGVQCCGGTDSIDLYESSGATGLQNQLTESTEWLAPLPHDDIPPCLAEPCGRNGLCKESTEEIEGYVCVCFQGYEGTKCKTDIDECSSNPCTKYQYCVDGVNTFECFDFDTAASLQDVLTPVSTTEQVEEPTEASIKASVSKLTPYVIGEALRNAAGLDIQAARESASFDMLYCNYRHDGTGGCSELFKTFYVDPVYGFCFTFNDEVSNASHPTRSGLAETALELIMDIHGSQYLDTVQTTGIKVALHRPGTPPFFPESTVLSVPPRMRTDISIGLERVKSMKEPYGTCFEYVNDTNIYYYDGLYSLSGCQRSRMQRMIMQQCGCASPLYATPGDDWPLCTTRNVACIDRVNEYTDVESADADVLTHCAPPCDYFKYTADTSATKWPRINQGSNVVYGGDSLINLRLSVRSVTYQTIEERPLRQTVQYVSKFGSLGGCTLGGSFVSVFEVLIWLLHSMMA